MAMLKFKDVTTLKALKPRTQIELVHDDGVYLFAKEGKKIVVVYAEGCNPEKNKNYYETSCHLVGGGDFAHPLGTVKKLFHPMATFFEIDYR